ncbi:MAG: hypothetical protein JO152_04985 [Mycobacteriaceae bacterium]|nr:hypothetical protein [Mycobacteriaceae bacterium]
MAIASVSPLVGCSRSVAGTPIASLAPPGADLADPAQWDSGSYPTLPDEPLGTDPVTDGKVLEARRMANYVVVPSQVDPGIARVMPQNTFVLTDDDDLPGPISPSRGQQFIVGFSSARSSVLGPSRVLVNEVQRYADATAAGAAGTEIAMDYSRAADGRFPGNVSIPLHPDAVAFGFDTGDGIDFYSIAAHGPYVLYQYVRSDTIDGARALAARTLDLQEPLIDRFVPSDPSRFASLPADPTGLMGRTLAVNSVSLPSVYLVPAALHVQADPVGWMPVFAAAGVDAVAVGRATVYQAADAVGAQRVADKLTTDRMKWGYRPAPGVAGLPMARCFDGGHDGDVSPRRFYCVGLAGRYAFEVFANQELDAHQQVAAQYRMLTAE